MDDLNDFSIEMKPPTIYRALTFLYFLLAGITWVSGEAGSGISGRLTLADIVASLVIFIFLISIIGKKRSSFRMPVEYRAYLPLLIIFFLGACLARNIKISGIELAIHAFTFSSSLAIFNLLCRDSLEDAVKSVLNSILWAGGILAIIGLVDFLLWPSLLPGDDQTGLSGTFRNTGQAGAFYGTYLAILIPGILSRIIPAKPINIALILALIAALVFTSKRAAMLGLGIGIIILSISLIASPSKRDKRIGATIIGSTSLLVPLIYLSFIWAIKNIDGMAWRFGRKFNADVASEFKDGFLAENISTAFAAFLDSPVLGVGLGNVVGFFSEEYEIHSTYLAILGNSGSLGAATYTFFISIYLIRIINNIDSSSMGLYLRYFMPMLLGLMVSWSYTYHLRKREFWIMFIVTSLVCTATRMSRRLAKSQAQPFAHMRPISKAGGR